MEYESFDNTKNKLEKIWNRTEDNLADSSELKSDSIIPITNLIFSKGTVKYELATFVLSTFYLAFNLSVELKDIPIHILSSAYIIDHVYVDPDSQLQFYNWYYHVPFFIRNIDNNYFIQSSIPIRNHPSNFLYRDLSIYIPMINQIYSIQKHKV